MGTTSGVGIGAAGLAAPLKTMFEVRPDSARSWDPFKRFLRISAHRGRRFRLIVDGVSAGSWTAFQSDRGRRFSEIVDDRGCAKVIH